jgi:hypothetical protein
LKQISEALKCLRYLDLNGSLGVFGPEEAKKPIEEYIRKYQPICQDLDVQALLAATRPETSMNLKMNIALHLMEVFREEIAEGMIINRELFLEALDAGCEPIDFAAWS